VSTVKLPRSENQTRRHTAQEIVYLVAPSGNPNYGDEFILRAWLRYLARARPEADVVVDCHTPGQAAVLHRAWHPRVTFVDTIWRICFDTAHLPPTEAIAVAEGVVRDPGTMPRIVSGIDLMARADTVHLVGGGYVNAVWSHHLALLAATTAAVDRSGGIAIATGQGLVPVGDPERLSLLRSLQERFSLFDVRDGPSYAAITRSGGRTTFTGDDAWLGIRDGGVYDTVSEAARRSFVFCLQSDLMDDFADGQGTEGLTNAIARLIEQWRLDGEDVAVVEGMPGSDRIVFDRVAHLLTGVVFVPFTDVWNRGLPARAGQTWVSTRFHPHLLAAATGASGLALSGRSDYYPIKHQSLVAAGSRWQVIESSELPSKPVQDGGFTAHTVEQLRRRKSTLAAQLYPPAPFSPMRRALEALRVTKRPPAG
jgi:polysaccharide pyruvyl transferase WcaK-like protein